MCVLIVDRVPITVHLVDRVLRRSVDILAVAVDAVLRVKQI